MLCRPARLLLTAIVGVSLNGFDATVSSSYAATRVEGKLVDVGPNYIIVDDGTSPRQFSHTITRRPLYGGPGVAITGFIKLENVPLGTPIFLLGSVAPGETDLSNWSIIAHPFAQAQRTPMEEKQALSVGAGGKQSWSIILWGTLTSLDPLKLTMLKSAMNNTSYMIVQSPMQKQPVTQPVPPLFVAGQPIVLDRNKQYKPPNGVVPKYPEGTVEIRLANDLSFAHKGAKVSLLIDPQNPAEAMNISIERTESLPVDALKPQKRGKAKI